MHSHYNSQSDDDEEKQQVEEQEEEKFAFENLKNPQSKKDLIDLGRKYVNNNYIEFIDENINFYANQFYLDNKDHYDALEPNANISKQEENNSENKVEKTEKANALKNENENVKNENAARSEKKSTKPKKQVQFSEEVDVHEVANLKELKIEVLSELANYYKKESFTERFKKGTAFERQHKHNERAEAVNNAIKAAKDDITILKILKNQKDLFTKDQFPYDASLGLPEYYATTMSNRPEPGVEITDVFYKVIVNAEKIANDTMNLNSDYSRQLDPKTKNNQNEDLEEKESTAKINEKYEILTNQFKQNIEAQKNKRNSLVGKSVVGMEKNSHQHGSAATIYEKLGVSEKKLNISLAQNREKNSPNLQKGDDKNKKPESTLNKPQQKKTAFDKVDALKLTSNTLPKPGGNRRP